MSDALDHARFGLDYLRSDLDARLKVASTKVQLAEASMDILKKQVEIASEIAKQNRMAAAYQDFSYARKQALSELRKLKRHQNNEERRLRDLKGLIAGDNPAAGWAGFRYFVRRVTFGAIEKLNAITVQGDPCLAVFDRQRASGTTPVGEVLQALTAALAVMAEDMKAQAERTRLDLIDLQKRADSIRTADWKTVNLDTSWIK